MILVPQTKIWLFPRDPEGFQSEGRAEVSISIIELRVPVPGTWYKRDISLASRRVFVKERPVNRRWQSRSSDRLVHIGTSRSCSFYRHCTRQETNFDQMQQLQVSTFLGWAVLCILYVGNKWSQMNPHGWLIFEMASGIASFEYRFCSFSHFSVI